MKVRSVMMFDNQGGIVIVSLADLKADNGIILFFDAVVSKNKKF
jgi:hypothetical protein